MESPYRVTPEQARQHALELVGWLNSPRLVHPAADRARLEAFAEVLLDAEGRIAVAGLPLDRRARFLYLARSYARMARTYFHPNGENVMLRWVLEQRLVGLAEALGPAAPSATGDPSAENPWRDVRLEFLAEQAARLHVPGWKAQPVEPHDLGLLHAQTRKPRKAWRLLVDLARGLCSPTTPHEREALRKLTAKANEALRDYAAKVGATELAGAPALEWRDGTPLPALRLSAPTSGKTNAPVPEIRDRDVDLFSVYAEEIAR